jgi:hypothetical protein
MNDLSKTDREEVELITKWIILTDLTNIGKHKA